MKGIKYKMKYTPVVFNFKTKKVEFGEDMTAEIIMLNGSPLSKDD
jgi:hypothetical protein